MSEPVIPLNAPMKRSDFASDAAYMRYLNGLAEVVDMLFTQRSHAANALDADMAPLNNPPKGDGR